MHSVRRRTMMRKIYVSLVVCLAAGSLAAGSSASAAMSQGTSGTPATAAQLSGQAADGTTGDFGVQAVPVQAKYSPLGATANGPSGPASARFTAGPHCCPSTAVVLTPQQIITENDFQWMNLGLPWDNTSVTSVVVCYAITGSGQTYISQTRLTTMTLPNSATVMLDEPTNRTSTTPVCYSVPANFTPNGALTLSLKVVFGSTSDRITIGLVSVSGLSE